MNSVLQIDRKDSRKIVVIDVVKLTKIISTALILLGLTSLLIFSYASNFLLFEELATASFIIVCILFIKLKGEIKTKY